MKDAVADALFPKARQHVLGLLFGQPDQQFYLRQIVSLTGLGLGSVQREVARLSAAGVIRRTKNGQHVNFQADPQCPIYEELRGIVRKTVGAPAALAEALSPLADQLKLAFIFGSVAKGTESKLSDIDLMVVGDVTFADVVDTLRDAEKTTRRDVNVVVYAASEFAAKLGVKNHFLTRVCAGEKLFLIGDERELTALSR